MPAKKTAVATAAFKDVIFVVIGILAMKSHLFFSIMEMPLPSFPITKHIGPL